MNKKIQIIAFIALCGLGIWYGFYQRKQLDISNNTTLGQIENVEYLAKGSGYFVSYNYLVNGKLLFSKSPIPYAKFNDIIFLRSILENKKLSVLYQKDNPSNSTMLFTTSEYDKHSIEIPDESKQLVIQIDSIINASK